MIVTILLGHCMLTVSLYNVHGIKLFASQFSVEFDVDVLHSDHRSMCRTVNASLPDLANKQLENRH